VRLERDVAGSASFAIGGEGGAVVVLRKPWWPGWSAEQAGSRLAVLRAAGAQVAVVVEDVSRGPVSLRYQTPGVASGITAAVAGALLLGCAAVLAARGGTRGKGRKQRAPGPSNADAKPTSAPAA